MGQGRAKEAPGTRRPAFTDAERMTRIARGLRFDSRSSAKSQKKTGDRSPVLIGWTDAGLSCVRRHLGRHWRRSRFFAREQCGLRSKQLLTPARVVIRETGARRDQPADDDVLLQAPQIVA